ncbi:MAG: pyruvate kinase [Bacilli bacterium]|nr:pyruvate kinase [Bacilli bacterium]
MKKTKIICSIGPASTKYDVMTKMIKNGMNVARINFSHATLEEKEAVVSLVKTINHDMNSNVAILFDTKGPDFRTGLVENGEILLEEGKNILIVKDDVVGSNQSITVNYKEAIDDIEVGDIILLEDGLMKLAVVAKDERGLNCDIIVGGLLGDRKGVNVPGKKLKVPFISKQDEEDIIYACHHDGDFLALSFVSSKEDILAVKEIIAKENSNIRLISKVESKTAIENIDDIIANSDGVMVARGDLGVEMPMHELPILQKMIIKKCREQGKFCIVATEMLESMKKNARPTRAEVSDIANAVLDGTDAVMLSGETTVGKYPEVAVKYMADVCENTENHIDYKNQTTCMLTPDITSTIASSVVDSANILDVKVIVASTMSGYTAHKISTLRPKSLVLAETPSNKVARSLALHFGVYPVIVKIYDNTDDIISDSVINAKAFMSLKDKDIIIITGGFPNNTSVKTTNFMKIQEI